MKAGRWIVAIIGVAAALCFALVAGRSVSVLAITPSHFRASSVAFALISTWLAYKAMQAATSGNADGEGILRGLLGGIAGACVGALIVLATFAMFAQATRAYVAHPLGLHFVDVTMFRLLIAAVWLGFGGGFVIRIPKLRSREPS